MPIRRTNEHGFLLPLVMIGVWIVFQFVHQIISHTLSAQQIDFLREEKLKVYYEALGGMERVLAEQDQLDKQTKWTWKTDSGIQLQVNIEKSSDQAELVYLLRSSAVGSFGIKETIYGQFRVSTGELIRTSQRPNL